MRRHICRTVDFFDFSTMEKRFDKEMAAFGERVRDLRNERGWSQEDLADESKIERGDISRLENGKKNIEFYTIVKLAIAFQVELSDFFPKK